jgi:hypothetical protein
MQRTWDRAMLLARTRGAYGCDFPEPGTTFPAPTGGTMLNDLCFVATCTDEEYDALLAAIREDVKQWKDRVAASRGKGKLTSTGNNDLLREVDVSKLEINL